jgi:hypothetical protein
VTFDTWFKKRWVLALLLMVSVPVYLYFSASPKSSLNEFSAEVRQFIVIEFGADSVIVRENLHGTEFLFSDLIGFWEIRKSDSSQVLQKREAPDSDREWFVAELTGQWVDLDGMAWDDFNFQRGVVYLDGAQTCDQKKCKFYLLESFSRAFLMALRN